jgi:hypothetical protein
MLFLKKNFKKESIALRNLAALRFCFETLRVGIAVLR